MRHDVGEIGPDETAADTMDALSVEAVDGTGRSYYLRDTGTWGQMREYFVHRSLYHLKEADPHAFAIPRLIGQAKASFVAVEFDEYGGGRGALVHQQLFADLMDARSLDSAPRISTRAGRRCCVGQRCHCSVCTARRAVPRSGISRRQGSRCANHIWSVTWCSASATSSRDRLATHVMDCWQAGRSSLCRPLT